MGTYLNPGKDAYQEAISSEIFIDKSEMIQCLNSVVKTNQKYVSVSLPRRFGKTMAADMICAYYDKGAKSRELFENTKLALCDPIQTRVNDIYWDTYLGKFNVIKLVMTDFFKPGTTVSNSLNTITASILDELSEAYPDVKYDPDHLSYSMDRFHRTTGTPFVVVIDEWDAIFRTHKEDTAGQTKYLAFLRNMMKDKTYIALAYMTGILPIKKTGNQAGLNMFTECSMAAPRQFASFIGFTEEEVKGLCTECHMDYQEISNWYNGYSFTDWIPSYGAEAYMTGAYQAHKISIYNPLSIVESMATGKIQNYWNYTETQKMLSEYIRKDFDGLKDAIALLIDGGQVVINTSTFQNDMTTFRYRDDVLTFLVHLGYLGYDDEKSAVFIPNREILDAFKASIHSPE